jgi:hypothetical protein
MSLLDDVISTDSILEEMEKVNGNIVATAAVFTEGDANRSKSSPWTICRRLRSGQA